MENNKEILWSILVKYDDMSNFEKFCNAISNFIQNKQNGNDIIDVYLSLGDIDKSDRFKINETIGGHIDLFLFSI